MSNRIDYFLKERSRVFIPNHKQWAQLFKRCPENYEKEIREVDGENVEVIVRYAYFMKQIPFKSEWEDEYEIVDGDEIFISANEYLEKYFDEMWDTN